MLVAPDSFKGTLGAARVAGAIGRGLERAGLRPPDLCPVADGGEGTADALLLGLGGETAGARVRDPLGRPRNAGFALIEDGGSAIVEVAAASGLPLLAEAERDPLRATSHGTGELIVAAVAAGAQVVLVACGGSATVDGGAGALEVLDDAGLRFDGRGAIDARLVCLCDVRTPWERAAATFGPQKGATPEQLPELEARMEAIAARLPRDPRGVAMTGAAGGIAGALWAAHGARLEPGARFVLDALDVRERMRAARAVVVGEGRIDATTLDGKVAGEIAVDARQGGIPSFAVVGRNALDPFGVRILDLQVVLEAGDAEALVDAGERLAAYL
ncbi:Glycerate kinase [Patulibacter medicamentivorans]|uniref:Glycerate kinase n=1 Tax=Patulibacter medicamentivorans TaxID=1097667 RepID=H0E7E0_9ACTN|nr:Glycerate kinase [Patulibacter medicamentivorans]